jgi:peptidyl-prolyl cis-trans isomerase SurA
MSRPCSVALMAVLLCALLAPGLANAAEVVDRIIAVVNKEVILLSELEEMLDYVEEIELRGLADVEREEAREGLMIDLLDGLIANKLVEQAMERADIEVGDREVEAAIADVSKQNGLTMERLFEELERQGIDEATYRKQLKDQIRQYQFMNLEIRGRVSVSEEDIRAAWLQGGADTRPQPAWRLQRLLLAFPPEADAGTLAALAVEADALLEQLRGGKDFAEVAGARSDDLSTKDKGGDAGVIKQRDLSAAFADALSAVEQGETVRVDLPTGIWLLRVAEEVDAAKKEFDEVRDTIAKRLYDDAMERELETWTDEQRRRAHVEIFM